MRTRSALLSIEVLVVLVVIGLFAVAVAAWTGGEVSALARHVVRAITSQRAHAVTMGAAGVVCIDPTAVVGRHASRVTWPPRGLTFTPDGLPRTCDGGGVGNTTILLEHRGRRAAVIVSSLGRVRWELR